MKFIYFTSFSPNLLTTIITCCISNQYSLNDENNSCNMALTLTFTSLVFRFLLVTEVLRDDRLRPTKILLDPNHTNAFSYDFSISIPTFGENNQNGNHKKNQCTREWSLTDLS